jgi:amino-acid N-acetyltransferase
MTTAALAVQIREAHAEDDALIKQMVREARLDPSKLIWQNFVMAEVNGEVVGIGQVRHHADGAHELGSLYTKKAYQGQGIAAQIIAALEAKYEKPMYLFCMSKMEPFYNRFGYQRVEDGKTLPWALRRKYRLTHLVRLFGFRVLIMRKD